jgi:6-phosphogluconolactonase
MAYENLLDLVPVPPSHIHKMETENIGPKASAEGYELILKRYFPATAGHKLENSFDLVLLGMGEDGHVLSLFPGTPGVHELERWVISLWLESQDMSRITLTQSIVNLSKKIAFLTTGSNKAHALREVLKGEYNPNQYPSQVINPVKGELHWFVDEAAASMLKIY